MPNPTKMGVSTEDKKDCVSAESGAPPDTAMRKRPPTCSWTFLNTMLSINDVGKL